MNNFVGIDLGTTNSAICTYDGNEVRVWKSPEQNDVTPSAIYFDRRGNKYVGRTAYDQSARNAESTAVYFKRVMGTSTPIHLPAVNLKLTPEECSAEILKTLYGYLPEEKRNDPESGTVITVPASFNQMQKEATMQAANLADLGKVALMQEPVAAVMSVMRTRHSNGIFVVYDIGGGTLDVAIAESAGGRVGLLSHGGIARCGGRDFDRYIFDGIIYPWLIENYALPKDFSILPEYRQLPELCRIAAEKAKIELSAKESTSINLLDFELQMKDRDGKEIYLDIPFNRSEFDKIIFERIQETIIVARDTIVKAGLSPKDLESIVFIGGPANYKPLRDMISSELGIPGNFEINPMTAVAEGASLFAESIDWSSQNNARKKNRGRVVSEGKLPVTFNYTARTPDLTAKLAVQISGIIEDGIEFQVDSLDTGWTSGRLPLKGGTVTELALTQNGENSFKIFVFDTSGGPVTLAEDRIRITRTAATVDAIPASHSVGIEVLDKIGGRPQLEYLVKSGDLLPKKGKKTFKTIESLKAGDSGSINFKLREGDYEDPITDNRFIGLFKISGSDFLDGVIPAGADLQCEFEMLDSGNVILQVTVPSIGAVFNSQKNYYSPQEGHQDYTSVHAQAHEESKQLLTRIDSIEKVIDDPMLDAARNKLQRAGSLNREQIDIEKSNEAMQDIEEARHMLLKVRQRHLATIRQNELDGTVAFFDQHVREHARTSEATEFDNLAKTTKRAIEKSDRDFDNLLDTLRGRNFEILWRQDWFVVSHFKFLLESSQRVTDMRRYSELSNQGNQFLSNDEIDKLRGIVAQLSLLRVDGATDSEFASIVNIARG